MEGREERVEERGRSLSFEGPLEGPFRTAHSSLPRYIWQVPSATLKFNGSISSKLCPTPPPPPPLVAPPLAAPSLAAPPLAAPSLAALSLAALPAMPPLLPPADPLAVPLADPLADPLASLRRCSRCSFVAVMSDMARSYSGVRRRVIVNVRARLWD